ncbi:MAG TPA: protein translocase subunit SecF [Micromonosporaceae bacterium]|jgi:preprotein translocase subunit SecF
MSGLATRLYRGEAGLNIVGKRKVWFAVAGVVVLIAILSIALRGFSLGIEFKGGNEFQIPASVGTMQRVEDEVSRELAALKTTEPARVVSAQKVGNGGSASYLVRTSPLSQTDSATVKSDLSDKLGIPANQISDNRVSPAWGQQVTQRALYGLLIFVALVMVYLIIRFEWRMAVAAVASLLLDLVFTAGVYSLVGFEVTPSTIIGFLTILGFALYDVVVVFDKIQENTRGITGSSNQTYAEAANLAVNQTLMRSINTGLVALLPVGGLLFIGAGLLGAGTLKDLGLVLFVGMGTAVYSSIFFATPVLVTLKEREPRFKAHTQRVLARRAAIARGEVAPKAARKAAAPAKAAAAPTKAAAADAASGSGGTRGSGEGTLAGATPRVGSRPSGKQRHGGSRGSRGGRPSGSKRR